QALSNAANSGLYKDAPWLMIFPGVFLVLTTLAFNLLGDGLRDALDPRSGR
ncbi:MAG: peptide/nickel transport system permease protein, partial [Gaiellaceae bacterium]|nr:peptide/nickel transport system permease protein [Gaiellaceae bacterium]